MLSVILLSYWSKISLLDVKYKTGPLVSLFASIITNIGLSLLLLREQQRSYKSSDLAALYIFVSMLCDITYLSMPLNALRSSTALQPARIRFCIHLLLLALEYCTKHPAPIHLSLNHSPEELHSTLSTTLFTWINPILRLGYKNVLTDKDLPHLSQDMKPERIKGAMLRIWSQRS